MWVLVARPAARAEETAARLSALGHTPILAPVLSIVPILDAPPPGLWDAILVTSRNAVPSLADRRGALHDVPVFAVGERTGGELARAGFRDVACAGGDGADLAKLVMARVGAPAKLLHAAGRDRRPEPARSLEAAGYALAIWEVYAAMPADELPDVVRQALMAGELDAVLHYSPRSAAILWRLVQEAGLAGPFGALRHLCLSPQVAAVLAGTDAGRISVAEAPAEDRLLALLERTD